MAIAENLEITIRVRLENPLQIGVKKRLAAKNSEETVAVPLCFLDKLVDILEADYYFVRFNIYQQPRQRKLHALVIDI